MIRVLYFARVREELGVGEESMTLPEGVRSVDALTAHLRARGPRWAGALAENRRLLVAVNQSVATAPAALNDGDEVAYFPPVTGG